MKKEHEPTRSKRSSNPFWHNQRGANRRRHRHRTPAGITATTNSTPNTFAVTGKRDRDFVPVSSNAHTGDIFAPFVVLFLLFLSMFPNRL